MKTNRRKIWVPTAAFLGLIFGLTVMSWIVGTFGVSTVTAQAIVKAVEVGSWGMFIASIATTGGLIGLGLWGAIKLMIAKAGSKAVVA